MTTIIGIKHENRLTIAADRGVKLPKRTVGHHLTTKLKKLDDNQGNATVIGFSGVMAAMQVVSHILDEFDYSFSTTADLLETVLAIRGTLADEYHFNMVTDDGILTMPVTMLIANAKSGLHVVYNGGEVIEVTEPYAAIGSGAEYALGSLHTMCAFPSTFRRHDDNVKFAMRAAALDPDTHTACESVTIECHVVDQPT